MFWRFAEIRQSYFFLFQWTKFLFGWFRSRGYGTGLWQHWYCWHPWTNWWHYANGRNKFAISKLKMLWNESEKGNTAYPMKNLSNFYLLLWDLTLIASALCITLNEIFFLPGSSHSFHYVQIKTSYIFFTTSMAKPSLKIGSPKRHLLDWSWPI